MAGFKCPFCGEIMSMQVETYSCFRLAFNRKVSFDSPAPCMEVDIYRCPNDECGKETVIVSGVNGYMENSAIQVYPSAKYRQFPEYVPLAIRKDYEEACSILNASPKAAATLARRCLQGMIRDFWGISGKNLNVEISQLRDNVPASQWKAIDAVRSIGNIGAHMEKDVDVIVDVDPEEAEKLIRLIEHLIEKWYIDRHDAEELFLELTTIAEEKAESRKG